MTVRRGVGRRGLPGTRPSPRPSRTSRVGQVHRSNRSVGPAAGVPARRPKHVALLGGHAECCVRVGWAPSRRGCCVWRLGLTGCFAEDVRGCRPVACQCSGGWRVIGTGGGVDLLDQLLGSGLVGMLAGGGADLADREGEPGRADAGGGQQGCRVVTSWLTLHHGPRELLIALGGVEIDQIRTVLSPVHPPNPSNPPTDMEVPE